MHPHVVISGIASLFPQDNHEIKSEAEMNKRSSVQIVTEAEVHRTQPGGLAEESAHSNDLHGSNSGEDGEWDKFKSHNEASKHASKQSFFQRSLAFMAQHSDDKIVKFVKKHKDNPLGAAMTWIVEHFTFGIIMFEPHELLLRYKALEIWDKPWINYWTITVERPISSGRSTPTHSSSHSSSLSEVTMIDPPKPIEEYSSIGDLYTDMNESRSELPITVHQGAVERSSPGSLHSPSPSSTSSMARRKPTKARQFITVPPSKTPYSSRWESVQIGGVKDEVGAHCGIFIRGQNLEYEQFVKRVADRVYSWVLKL